MKFTLIFAAIVGLACAVPTQRSGLKDDLDELLALLPTEKLIALYHKYENDADVKEVISYLKSKDFAKVVDIVKQVSEVREIVDYIEAQGVPVIDILNKLADRLGLGHWNAYTKYTIQSSRSFKDLYSELLTVVDVDQIVAFLFDKLANSEAVQNLYEKVASVDFQKLHDSALSHPEITDLISRLENRGINVKAIWEMVKSLFGWESTFRNFNTRSLRTDVDEFLALIPTKELIALYHEYENDADIKRVVAYLKSSDFASVVHIIAEVSEIRDLVSYLESKGLHVIDLLNKLADRLGLPHWTVYTSRTVYSSRTWRDFITAAKKLVNVDKVKALVVDKLANSADFQELYERIANVDYQKLHAAALSHPEIRDALSRLAAMGVDVSQIWNLVKGFFGWE